MVHVAQRLASTIGALHDDGVWAHAVRWYQGVAWLGNLVRLLRGRDSQGGAGRLCCAWWNTCRAKHHDVRPSWCTQSGAFQYEHVLTCIVWLVIGWEAVSSALWLCVLLEWA